MATIKQRIDGVTENVTDGKQDIASAITDKGVSTSSSATFSTMANNIRAIETPPRDRIVNSANTIYVITKDSGVTIGYSGNTISGTYAIAEGYYTKANGDKSHTEGDSTTASGEAAHAEGIGTVASGSSSHSEGLTTKANGDRSHAEGAFSIASGNQSHAEGSGTTAYGTNSHAEGEGTRADATSTHAEGNGTLASGVYSHSEGSSTQATSYCAHAEGSGCTANGAYSHAEGNNTQALNPSEHACGKYNKSTTGASTGATLFSVGFGNSSSARANAIEITQSGTLKAVQAWIIGSDRKLKENITSLENNTLEKVLQLNPVRFTLKSDISKKKRIGFIAQEVETVFPEYVTVSVDNEGEETRYLDYSQMVSILCKSLQEQQKEIEELKKLININ